MATFRKIRDHCLSCGSFEYIIDEDDFLLLYHLNTSKNLDFLYDDYVRFDLGNMDAMKPPKYHLI